MALFEKEKEEFIESYDKNGMHIFSEKVGDVTNALNELGWFMEDGRHLNDDEDNSLLNNKEALETMKNRFEELLDEMAEMKDIVNQQINSLERKIGNLEKEI